jgi:predicted ATPase/class 3 adenylate cyclase
MSDLPSGTVTFLFTDIEGSTGLLTALGGRYHELQASHHDLIRSSVEGHDGVVVNTMGDGLFAAFASARDAVGGAVAAQLALSAHPWPDEGAIRVRMGIHTGQADARDGGYVSLAVHHAARVGDAGHGGQIVVSDVSRALLGDGFDGIGLRDLGPHRLKDLTEAVHLHQVCHAGLLDRFPPLRSLDQVPHNLPIQLTSFVGRDVEVREVTKLVTDDRLVTLTGAGGSGKTRLALQVAADVADEHLGGVWLVELASVVDPDAVVLAVADAMYIQAEPGRTPLELVLARLATSDSLVVLDNCEHVLDAATDLAAAVLSQCPRTTMLATSREPLGVPGETVWRIPSMATDEGDDALSSDAVRLFLERASHVAPEWTPTTESDRDALVEICRRLDGIPLAIELAAARLDVLDLDAIRRRLHDRFKLLTGGSRVTLERQRTLWATVDWSHTLLEPEASILFRRLAVFYGGFTLDAAEAVCADESLTAHDVLDLLGDLVRKSLVVVDRSNASTRYVMLETIRQYARQVLLESGESESVQVAHHRWCVELVDRTWRRLHYRDLDEVAWYEAVAAEQDNIVSALTWAADLDDPRPLDELLTRAANAWGHSGGVNLAAHWNEVALAHQGEHDPTDRSLLLMNRAVLALFANDVEAARIAFDVAVSARPASEDAWLEIAFLLNEANLCSAELDFEGQFRCNDAALAIARQTGDLVHEAKLLSNQSTWASATGQGDLAERFLSDALTVARDAGARVSEAFASMNTVAMWFARHETATADALLDEVLPLVERIGEPKLLSGALYMRTWRALMRDLGLAERLANETLAAARRFGVAATEVIALNFLGGIAFVRGDDVEARRVWAEAHRRALPGRPADNPSTGFDEWLALLDGDIDEAARLADLNRQRNEIRATSSGGLYVAALRRDIGAMADWIATLDQQHNATGATRANTPTEIARGFLRLESGDLDGASESFRLALQMEVEDGDTFFCLDALTGLGAIAAANQDVETAGRLLGAVDAVRNELDMRRSSLPVHLWCDDAIARAEAVDADGFATAWAHGQTTTAAGLLTLADECAAAGVEL